MNGHVLHTVESEKDLGVIIRSDLKASDQCASAYAKASKVLGMIGRNIHYKETNVMLRLYKSLVRPHVEYCTVAWSVHYAKDKQLLERIQRRFIKMIPACKDLKYEDALKNLGLVTLEEKRNRADLIFLFKMYKGLTQPSFDTLFHLSKYEGTRGHSLKLNKHSTNRDVRHFFFSERVINNWNQLDQNVIDATSVNMFKKQLQHYRKYKMDLFLD